MALLPVAPELLSPRKPGPLAFTLDRVVIGWSLSDIPELADPEVIFFLEPEGAFLPLAATEADDCFGRETSSSGTIRVDTNTAGGGSSSETPEESLKNFRVEA
jgi:hypothetical protein